MPPPLAFATSNEYVFQRDFISNKWIPIIPDNKPCIVSFMKRDSNYFMRLKKPGEPPKDFPLARESKFHYSPDGFLQIPLANVKELYAIKFKQKVDGEMFYAKIVNEMNLPWSAPKTNIEDNKMPAPMVNYGPATMPPATQTREPLRRNDFNQEQLNKPPPHDPVSSQGFVPRHTGQPVAPDPQPFRNMGAQYPPSQPLAVPNPVARNPAPPTNNADQRFYDQQDQFRIPLNQLNTGMGNPNMGNPNMGNPNMGNPNMGNPNMGNPNMGNPNMGNPNMGNPNMGNPNMGNPRHNMGNPNMGNMGSNYPDYYTPSQLSRTPPGGYPQQPRDYTPGSTGVRNPVQLPAKQQKHRDPEPVPEAEQGGLAKRLMEAINHGDSSHAECLIKMAITSKVNFTIECKETVKKESEPTFMLEVGVEFQQPQKKPLSVFLYEIRESETILDLQAKVEKLFFIPRSSQNWIIGPKLIKNDDKRSIKEHGLRYTQGGDTQKAYLYVMHTKKANVAKEELEAIQNRQRVQNRQQGVSGPPLLPDNNRGYPQQPGRQQQYPGNPGMNQGYGQVPGQQRQGMMDDPTYDVIGNRGYAPGFNEVGLPRFRVNQDPGIHPQQYQQQMTGTEHLYGTVGHRGPNAAGPVPPPQHFASSGPPQRAGNVSRPPPGAVNVLPPNVMPRGRPVQEPEPVPEPVKPQGWQCEFCTFINKPARPGCEQCGNAPPNDYEVPEDAPLTSMQLDAQKNDLLFQQFEQQDAAHRKEEALRNYQEMLNAEEAQLITNKKAFDCLICYTPVEPEEGVVLRSCLHEFCKDCLKDTITNAQTANIQCPFDNGEYQCGMDISEREMRAVLTEEELEAVYRRGLREAENASANSFHCKSVDCRGFCFYEDDVNEFHCPVCGKRNCLLCKAIHEGMDCKEYQDDLKRRAANDEAAKATQEMLENLVKDGVAMKCPQCQIIVQKKDGCDWVRCSMCRTEICWATKGPRWGPKGHGDTSGGCRCRVNGKKCTPECRNCH